MSVRARGMQTALSRKGYQMFCYKCGFEVPDDAAFCSKCGTPLASNVASAATQPAQPANTILHITRKKNFNGSALVFEVQIDGAPRGVLKNGGSCDIDVPNGSHLLTFKHGRDIASSNLVCNGGDMNIEFATGFMGMQITQI